MNITLSENAAQHVKQMLARRGYGIGLRVGTRASGCNGFAYEVDYADEIGDGDHVIESCGIKLIVDKQSLGLLEGMEIDYVKNNVLNEGFQFNNPNVKNMCGCGESFNV